MHILDRNSLRFNIIDFIIRQLAVSIFIDAKRIHHTVTIDVGHNGRSTIRMAIADGRNYAVLTLDLFYLDNMDCDSGIARIDAIIAPDRLGRVLDRLNLRLIGCRRVRIGVNLRGGLHTECGTILGPHGLPFRIICAESAIEMSMPGEHAAGTDFCASSGKRLAKGHIIIDGMCLVNIEIRHCSCSTMTSTARFSVIHLIPFRNDRSGKDSSACA